MRAAGRQWRGPDVGGTWLQVGAPHRTELHRLRLSVGGRLPHVDGSGAGRNVDIGLTRRRAGLRRLDAIDEGGVSLGERKDGQDPTRSSKRFPCWMIR